MRPWRRRLQLLGVGADGRSHEQASRQKSHFPAGKVWLYCFRCSALPQERCWRNKRDKAALRFVFPCRWICPSRWLLYILELGIGHQGRQLAHRRVRLVRQEQPNEILAAGLSHLPAREAGITWGANDHLPRREEPLARAEGVSADLHHRAASCSATVSSIACSSSCASPTHPATGSCASWSK